LEEFIKSRNALKSVFPSDGLVSGYFTCSAGFVSAAFGFASGLAIAALAGVGLAESVDVLTVVSAFAGAGLIGSTFFGWLFVSSTLVTSVKTELAWDLVSIGLTI